MYAIFKLPKIIRLYNHSEYPPHKITSKLLNRQAKIFTLKIPINGISSPIKLLVPGNAIFAIVNIKKNVEIKVTTINIIIVNELKQKFQEISKDEE